MAEFIEREAAIEATYALHFKDLIQEALRNLPAADVPSALWTDEPISGTEFMTHNQGQSGFEIHFRTDDKAKYEAVQDECRRQIDHAKHPADVRPVVVCADCEHNNHCLTQEFVDDCGKIPLDRNTFFCADGERKSNA